MCLIAFQWQPEHEHRLVLIANRDEFHARPTRPLHWWDWPDGVIAGRDEKAGGTWLAADRSGRFAAITNFRQIDAPNGARSRGELPLAWLNSADSPAEFAEQLDARKQDYSPFSLLIGQVHQTGGALWLIGTHEPARAVKPGRHALSNHRLDTPWPKATRVVQRLRELLQPADAPPMIDLLNILNDRETAPDETLPDTGVGLEMERFLSAPMIVNERYGTRSATALTIATTVRIAERTFDAAGQVIGQRQFSWRRPAQ